MRPERGWTRQRIVEAFAQGRYLRDLAILAFAPEGALSDLGQRRQWEDSFDGACAQAEVESILRAALRERGKKEAV